VSITVIVLTVAVSLVTAFAGALAWAQHQARHLRTAPAANTPRPRRRPF
jgi:hypothetical protein